MDLRKIIYLLDTWNTPYVYVKRIQNSKFVSIPSSSNPHNRISSNGFEKRKRKKIGIAERPPR